MFLVKASLLSTVSTLMATDDNATFEQREITLRIALRGIGYCNSIYVGRAHGQIAGDMKQEDWH